MTDHNLTKNGAFLQQAINNISVFDNQKKAAHNEETLHVPNVANVLLFAYEQLRNASENIEDHLLLQRAILRFYKRNLTLSSNRSAEGIARELIIELTQAEYIENDTIALSTITKIDDLVKESLAQHKIISASINSETARKWTLEVISVKTEHLINNPIRILSFAHFAHAHFSEIIDYDKLTNKNETISKDDYPTLLYIAIHKALLKSDDANVRVNLVDLYPSSITSPDKLIEFNKRYDELAALKTTATITKFVTKNGAALRMIRSAFFESDHEKTIPVDLAKKVQVDNIVEQTIDSEYKRVRKTVNAGVIKSIVFLLITKAIIGLLIEIPYDLAVTGSIVILPLAINLFFPAIFIAISALTFRMPGEDNKDALQRYIQAVIYTEQRQSLPMPKYTEKVGGSFVFNTIYVITFALAFYIIGSRLQALGFNIVQGMIFFIFFSTASFLGYRLTLQIKEIEQVTTNQGFIAILRDFFYSPFIFIGKKISYRFGQLNIIAQILDIIIDLPLKTSVRLVRQWNVFLNNKKDELL